MLYGENIPTISLLSFIILCNRFLDIHIIENLSRFVLFYYHALNAQLKSLRNLDSSSGQ